MSKSTQNVGTKRKLPRWQQITAPRSFSEKTTPTAINPRKRRSVRHAATNIQATVAPDDNNGVLTQEQKAALEGAKQEARIRHEASIYLHSMVDSLYRKSVEMTLQSTLDEMTKFLFPYLDGQGETNGQEENSVTGDSPTNANESRMQHEKYDIDEPIDDDKKPKAKNLSFESDCGNRNQEFNESSPSNLRDPSREDEHEILPDPDLLPVALFEVQNLCMHDRTYLVKHICAFQPLHLIKRVHLYGNTKCTNEPNAQQVTLADLMKRLILECWSADSAILTQIKRRWKTLTISECATILLSWANEEEQYHGLAIILEGVEALPIATIESFLNQIKYMRVNDGLPVSVIIASSASESSGLPPLLPISCIHGLLIKNWSVNPNTLIEKFIENSYTFDFGTTCLPLLHFFNTPNILSNLRQCRSMFHASAMTTIHQLKEVMDNSLTHQGSFFIVCADEKFVESQGRALYQSIAYLCQEPVFYSILTRLPQPNDTTTDGFNKLSLADWNSALQRLVSFHRRVSDILLVINSCLEELPTTIKSTPEEIISEILTVASGKIAKVGSILVKFLDSLYECETITLLRVLQNVKSKLKARSKFSQNSQMVNLCRDAPLVSIDLKANSEKKCYRRQLDEINEHILFVGEMHSQKKDLKNQVHANVVSWLYQQIKSCTSSQDEHDTVAAKALAMYCKLCVSFPFTSIYAHPRRNAAQALARPAVNMKSADTCLIFQLFEERMASCEDLFDLFQEALGSGSKQDAWARFTFAMYELQRLGFVSIKERAVGRGGIATFEKRAMVWAQGT